MSQYDDDPPTLRVVVKVTRGSHPELYTALRVVARHGRAERLRHMCTAFLLGRYHASTGAGASDGDPGEDADEFRLVVKINPGAHSELYRAILSVSPRGRAERLRHMGTVFVSGLVGTSAPPSSLPLADMREGADAPSHDTSRQPSPPVQAGDADTVSADDLMGNFVRSL